MPKMSDVSRSATNQERVRNMKAMCLNCRNGEPVEYLKEPESNIAYWSHPSGICEAGPIRNRALKYASHHGPIPAR